MVLLWLLRSLDNALRRAPLTSSAAFEILNSVQEELTLQIIEYEVLDLVLSLLLECPDALILGRALRRTGVGSAGALDIQ